MDKRKISIFFGTETGNAQELAEKSAEILNSKNHETRVLNLEDTSPSDLGDTEFALFFVSTWGEGDPPLDAEDFFESLKNHDSNLNNLRYGIMGLGDSSYAIFNGFARDLDNELGKLGAIRLVDRVEADLDFENDFEEFIEKMTDVFKND